MADPTLPPASRSGRNGAGPDGESPDGRRAGGKRKAMVNRNAKGTAVELQAIKVLEAEGYVVHRCVRTGAKRGKLWISQSNDVFGCIDLVAKKHGERTRWIQVTSDGGIGRKKDDMAKVPWDPLFDSVEIWRWVGGNRRKHKTTGEWLDRQYFQIYHHDDGFDLQPDRRVRAPTDEAPVAARAQRRSATAAERIRPGEGGRAAGT